MSGGSESGEDLVREVVMEEQAVAGACVKMCWKYLTRFFMVCTGCNGAGWGGWGG